MNGKMDRIDLLINLAANERADNEEWRKAVYREGQERAKRVLDLIQRFEYEYAALDAERQKLSQYLPRNQQQLPEEPMPRAVTQGPRPNEPVQRKVNP